MQFGGGQHKAPKHLAVLGRSLLTAPGPRGGVQAGLCSGVTEQSAQPAKDTSLGQTTQHSHETSPLVTPQAGETTAHTAAKGKSPHLKEPSCKGHFPAAHTHFLPALTQLLQNAQK